MDFSRFAFGAPKPISAVFVERAQGNGYRIGSATVQGLRDTHEDDHCMSIGEDRCLLSIFDGHRGRTAATFCAKNYEECLDTALMCGGKLPGALRQTHIQLDKKFRRCGDASGSTCVAAVIEPAPASAKPGVKWHIHVAHAGDARAVLIRSGKMGASRILATEDHKPNRPDEVARIEASGGFVMDMFGVHRVDGLLSCSRALGSLDFKDENAEPHKTRVSCIPETDTWEVKDGDWLIMGCDGVWDVLENSQLSSLFFKNEHTANNDPGEIANRIVQGAIDRDSTDNISATVVQFGADESAASSIEYSYASSSKEKSFPKFGTKTCDVSAPELDVHCQTGRLRHKYKTFLEMHGYTLVSTKNDEGFDDYTCKKLETIEEEESSQSTHLCHKKYPGAYIFPPEPTEEATEPAEIVSATSLPSTAPRGVDNK